MTLSLLDVPAVIATLIGLLYTVPQLFKSFRKNATAKDVAIGSWYLILFGEIFWGINAVIYRLPVNLFSCVINVAFIVVLVFRLRYLINKDLTLARQTVSSDTK